MLNMEVSLSYSTLCLVWRRYHAALLANSSEESQEVGITQDFSIGGAHCLDELVHPD